MPASAQAADLHSKKEDTGDVLMASPFLIINPMKTATTLDQQITKLKERGMCITDDVKAKEILFDIGYYRLGFYWFPFEKGYPAKNNRKHRFIDGTSFDSAVLLYYFDNDLRNKLAPYLHRIEICFRTAIIYIISNYYNEKPLWFVDSEVVNSSFIDAFEGTYKDIKKNEAIKRHHQKYPSDIFAPAWKTLEYMTFGGMLYLYQNLKNESLKRMIAQRFNIKNLGAFESYMKTIRIIRNVCAHGHNLYDIHFPQSIKVGELKGLDSRQRNNISGGLIVIELILSAISGNRSRDFHSDIETLLAKPEFAPVRKIISHISLTPAKVYSD